MMKNIGSPSVLEGDDPVPLGLVDLVAGLAIYVALVGRDAQVGDAAALMSWLTVTSAPRRPISSTLLSRKPWGISFMDWMMTMGEERRGPGSLSRTPFVHSSQALL